MMERFELPLCPTLNEIIRAAEEGYYRKLKHRYTAECAILALGKKPFSGKVWLHYHWHIGTDRRDPDNTFAASKAVLDGLVNIGVLEDDSSRVIQSPVIHTWELRRPEKLILRVSDSPIFTLTEIC